jgi:exosortase
MILGETTLSQTTHISPLEYSTDRSNDRFWGLSAFAWVQIVTVAVLMVALFRFNLARLWGKTNPINGQDPNWQHSVFVPLIGLYYLYIHREELFRAALEPARRYMSIRVLACIGLGLIGALGMELMSSGEMGFPLMLLGALAAGLAVPAMIPTASSLGTVLLLEGLIVFAYGIFPGQNDYLKDLGMVITLFGVTTLLCGWAVMKVAWFPIVFLVVALPWPELVYAKLAWPLQKLAASVAVGTLRLFGVDAQNTGTRITMMDMKGNQRLLNVAEACAGLKSVMTFLMVAGTVAFLGTRALWEKAVIALSAIPIAIFCNVMRVSGQGLLDRYVSREWSEGFAHQFAGLVMLVPGFFMILAVGWILEKLFIEEVDKNELAIAGTAAAAAAGAAVKTGRSKRVIVEVPRKNLNSAVASAGNGNGSGNGDHMPDEEVVIAAPGVPVAVTNAPAAAPKPAAPKPLAAKPAAPGPAQPPRAVAPPAALRPSTLKPSPVKDRLPANPGALPASTLKPSSKPSTTSSPRAATSPAASTLKPSAPKPRTGVPQAPAGTRPPSAKPPQSPTGSANANQEGAGRS